MTVAYLEGPSPAWRDSAICSVVVISLLVAYMCYVILKQNHWHTIYVAQQQDLLLKNARKAALSERALNDFVAHEGSYRTVYVTHLVIVPSCTAYSQILILFLPISKPGTYDVHRTTIYSSKSIEFRHQRLYVCVGYCGVTFAAEI